VPLADQILELFVGLELFAWLIDVLALDETVFDLGLAHSLDRSRYLDPVDLFALVALLFSRLSVGWLRVVASTHSLA